MPLATSAAASTDEHERLSGASDLAERSGAKAALSLPGRHGPARCRGQRDGGDALSQQRGLVVEADREAEIEELDERVLVARPLLALGERLASASRRALAGLRPFSPASSSLGVPGPATVSRLTTASTFSRKAASSARCAAPRLPQAPPSVETKTMVCPTVRVESSRASSIRWPCPTRCGRGPVPCRGCRGRP